MRIGYACLCLGVPGTHKRTLQLKNITENGLLDIIENNLNALEKMLDYNFENQIYLYRIGSDIIPFGSAPENNLKWWEIFQDKFQSIGSKIKKYQTRVSMHPGQYTVLNSPDEAIVRRAVADLEYHNRVLDALGLDGTHKLILHIGGVYKDKALARERFIANYRNLNEKIKKRLVIENDDKAFTVEDVLYISKKTGIPVIYDNLHNKLNPADSSKSDSYWIDLCHRTWKKKDGHQKIHYSEQSHTKQKGSHSHTIILHDFLSFYNSLPDKDIDIMLEVKDKNLSAVKCINTLTSSTLENEWNIYKYFVLERSLHHYSELQAIYKKEDSHLDFYKIIEEIAEKKPKKLLTILALNQIWKQLETHAEEKEAKRFAYLLLRLKKGTGSAVAVKNFLYKLAEKYKPSISRYLFFYDIYPN